MREKPKLDLGLTAYDDLFKDGKLLSQNLNLQKRQQKPSLRL